MSRRKTGSASGRPDVVKMSMRLSPRWAAFLKHCVVDESIAQRREVEVGEIVEKALPLLKKLRESKAAIAVSPGSETPTPAIEAPTAVAEISPADVDSAA